MLVVKQVFPDGHANMTDNHLSYVRDMANRIGFTVISRGGDIFPSEGLIRLHIEMTNPVFRVSLNDSDLDLDETGS